MACSNHTDLKEINIKKEKKNQKTTPHMGSFSVQKIMTHFS